MCHIRGHFTLTSQFQNGRALIGGDLLHIIFLLTIWKICTNGIKMGCALVGRGCSFIPKSKPEDLPQFPCQEDLDEAAPLDPRYVRVWNHTEAPLEVLAFPKDMVLGWCWRVFFRVRERMLGGRFQFFLGVYCYVSF